MGGALEQIHYARLLIATSIREVCVCEINDENHCTLCCNAEEDFDAEAIHELPNKDIVTFRSYHLTEEGK